MTQSSMENRVALVTGSSHGIGAATAKLLASHGAAVGVNYHSSEDAALSVVEEIESKGGKAIAVQGDVHNQESVQSMVDAVTKEFGDIDTLILNASGKFVIAPFVDYEWSDFEEKLLGDITSVFYPCKSVVPSMIKNNKGSIVAVSSGVSRSPRFGFSGDANPVGIGFTSHATAKSGIDGFVRNLAYELGPHNIRVNVVAPGVTDTDATGFISTEAKDKFAQNIPLKHIGQPEDVAEAILYLAGDTAKYITGSYLAVDGGLLML